MPLDRATRWLTSATVRAAVALALVGCPLVRPAVAAVSAALPGLSERSGEAGQEEARSEGKAAEEWAAAARPDHRPAPPLVLVAVVPAPVNRPPAGPALSRAAPADPFRNGLGSPPRC